MGGIKIRTSLLLAALAVAPMFPGVAAAATIPLSGSGSMTRSYEILAPNASTVADFSVDYLLGVPGQYTFTDTFQTQQSASSVLAASSVGGYSFLDSYRFAVSSAANGDSLVVSLGLGGTFDISNLQMRLYDVTNASPQTPSVPGLPSGSQVLALWTGNTGPSTSATTQTFYNLAAGHTYLLDVAGIADGSNGGTYIGQLNVQAVPLPAAAWLMLSGLGGLGVFRKRRAATPVTG